MLVSLKEDVEGIKNEKMLNEDHELLNNENADYGNDTRISAMAIEGKVDAKLKLIGVKLCVVIKN